MKTEQNRLVVAAQSLRISVGALRKLGRRVDDEAARARANALIQIDSVAAELETAAAPEVSPTTLSCGRAKSDMTPCVVRDGKIALSDDGFCVGCNVHISCTCDVAPFTCLQHAAKIPDPDGAARGGGAL